MPDVSLKVIGLFDELIEQGERIKGACKKMYFAGAKKEVDAQSYEAWRTSCLTLLRSTFGTSSPHYDRFSSVKLFDHYNSTLLYLGILAGAREDIRKGYFYNKDLMLSVNVMNTFLARAAALVKTGQAAKAAGILEAVVCEALRKLAEARGLPVDRASTSCVCAKALMACGALPKEAGAQVEQLEAFLKSPTVDGSSDFMAWHAWTEKLLYDYLGSTILIVN
jgi:hypothetical protein